MDIRLKGTLFNESEGYINSLSRSSAKPVKVICPMCGEERVLRYFKVNETGHTFCRECSKRKRSCDDMIGARFGKLTVLSYADEHFKSGGTLLKCVCDCGSVTNVSASHLKSGHTTSCGCYRAEYIQGENNPTYNPNLTDKDRKKWRLSQIAKWSKEVRKRDGSCAVCGATKNLVAHHLNSYKNNKELRLDVENGVTMCRDCHADFHVNFMGNYRVPCTKQDFDDYVLQV